MSFELKRIDKSKLYTSIVDQIVEGIQSGAFPREAALPSEREFAEQLGVSRGSLREAIRILEHAGILDVRTGSGTYVAKTEIPTTLALRARAELLGEHSPLDVMVARKVLEPLCAEQAARHRLTRDSALIHAAIGKQADPDATDEQKDEGDFGFHLAVACATHNPVLVTLAESLVGLMQESMWRTHKHRSWQRPQLESYIGQHRLIAECIEEGDPLGAARVMRKHLKDVESGLLAEADEVGEGSSL
jgi:GntR family transcriptional repressor for pyruvate dehydrogenase complex